MDLGSSLSRRSLIAGPFVARASTKPPNFVLFVSDDHGYRDSPLYGNRDLTTPNLSRLAAEGTVHTSAFVGSPTCVPSRAVLMTGLMPVRNGLEPNHGRLPDGIKTLPSYLKELGYKVAHFGKSHFAPPASYSDWEFVPSETKAGLLRNDLETAVFEKWVSGYRGNQPLCLVVGCHSPHVYWEENSGFDPARVTIPPNHVDTPETRAWRTRYYTDILRMDRQLGEVHQAAAARLGANTLFTYVADNGAQWPLAKWTLYDDGIRVPMVTSWPAGPKVAKRSDALISFSDFVPTFIELAGGRPPAGLDGQSFATVLRGQRGPRRDRIFAHHAADGKMNAYPMRCVRTATHKYIRNLRPDLRFRTHIDFGIAEDGVAYWRSWEAKAGTDPRAAAIVDRYRRRPAEELYDLRRDPYELHNLAARETADLSSLRVSLNEWMHQEGDKGNVFGTPVPLA